MKHAWRTDADGEIQPLDEDADHPVAQCRICGITSGCLHAQPDCTEIGAEPRLDADDCDGLDLSVRVSVSISHPGKATEYDDCAAVAMSELIPLSVLLSAKHDPVVKAIGDAVEVITGSWRGARTAHESAWRTAVEAAETPEANNER